MVSILCKVVVCGLVMMLMWCGKFGRVCLWLWLKSFLCFSFFFSCMKVV